MSELRPGTVIAERYAIVRLLGTGSTKRVYLAHDRLSDAQVALALLLPERASDPTLGARFSREARAASVLSSPYVVRVFDVGKTADGMRYFATEAVLGRGLDEAMEGGAVDPAAASRWTMQVLAGLAEAHARGVLHRDVKPENVLLAPTPAGEEVARLTDFGLAKLLDGALEGSIALRTAQGVIMGTPDYMAPEQWRGAALDGRADLYSVGVMLYEMLTGRAPFRAASLHAAYARHALEAPPAFPADAPALARALEPVVRRALAKEPGERYPSADAMRAAVEAVAGFGLVVPPVALASTARVVRAELVSDAWRGVVQLVAARGVVLGRDPSAHVVTRCLPAGDENAQRTRTVSRQHARIEWRGARAVLVDLASASGTWACGRPVGSEGAELQDGDEVALGPLVRLRFSHAPARAGELPAWARLARTDAFGADQVHVLVLTEAKLSSAADAAVRLPTRIAAGDLVRVRAVDGRLAVLGLGATQPVPLRDGETLRVGGATISVALEG